VESERQITPGRLRRLAEELIDEQIGAIEAVSQPDVLVDELDYALRPPRHEKRVPAFGAIVLPTRRPHSWSEVTGLSSTLSVTTDRSDDDARRYADGEVSWAVREADGVHAVAVFDRSAGSERDLVLLAEATGGMIVQRRTDGVVRLVGSFGVARWDGVNWHVEPPFGTWLERASCGFDDEATGVLDQMLRFAVHDLGAGGVGALIILAPTVSAGFEERLSSPPPLRVDRPTDLGPLRHVLTQVDGAAVFDEVGVLSHLGVRVVPSEESERVIPGVGGTRHTSARRYSFDDPDAIVVVVSESGPVTVFRNGEMVGRSALEDPAS